MFEEPIHRARSRPHLDGNDVICFGTTFHQGPTDQADTDQGAEQEPAGLRPRSRARGPRPAQTDRREQVGNPSSPATKYVRLMSRISKPRPLPPEPPGDQ